LEWCVLAHPRARQHRNVNKLSFMSISVPAVKSEEVDCYGFVTRSVVPGVPQQRRVVVASVRAS